ncbi:sec-independent translocase [Streptomyces apocyni]|uniref:sec-independent translocase n=1 Tax=Streptomyces apocyni TaxID=2654677 RepID=UPI0012EAD0BD|nr:sec-independent translocase [Streptomyces apocyni]
MFSDIGGLEVLTLLVLAVLLFGPEKLPKVIQDVAGFIRKIRAFSDSAKQDIREELGPEFKDFEFEDLNPKTFIRKQLESDELGLKEIRNGFDLKKEMAEVTDATRSLDPGKPMPSTSTSSSTGSGPDLTKNSGPDLRKSGGPNLDKGGAAPAAVERPPFDADAT